MLAMGVDISTRKIALAGLAYDGTLHTHAVHLPTADRGARRLSVARSILTQSLKAPKWQDTVVVVIEVAWPGFVLLSMTAVVMETVQTAFPGSIVSEVSAGTWMKETVGHGKASKPEYIAFAQAQGLETDDEDLAAATCMAVCAWERWNRDVGEAA